MWIAAGNPLEAGHYLVTTGRIVEMAFDGCTGLTAISVDTNNPAYSSLDGVLFNKSQTTIIQYPAGKAGSDYAIPNSVTNIGGDAFRDCTSLRGVYFLGNAPTADSYVFLSDNNVIVYYLPGTTGWGTTFGGLPTALWLPQVQTSDVSFGIRTNQFGFTVNWASDKVVVVEAATDLTNPTWSPVATNTLAGGSSYFSDPQWANYPRRFYRLRSL